jgi:hypothetical protein
MGPVDLDGHTFFHDRRQRRELANTVAIAVDLDTARITVGAPGDQHREELVFDDAAVQRAVVRLVDAMRRHAYRKRRVRPVPKPVSIARCDICGGKGRIWNPYIDETVPCPVCG